MMYNILIYNIWNAHHYTTATRLYTLTHTFFGMKSGRLRMPQQLQNLKVVGI